MKSVKLLFIIPSTGFAGTNSALSSIYNNIGADYDIRVLAINGLGKCVYDFNKSLVVSNFLTAWNADFVDLNKKQRIIARIVKPLKHLPHRYAVIAESLMFSLSAFCQKLRSHPDIVIGFQEGIATRYASHFRCKKKIAWLHCDYNRAYPLPINEIDLYNKYDSIVAVSEFTRSTFLGRYPSLGDKTLAIYNLLDAERIKVLTLEPVDDNRFLKQGFTIISVGRLDPVKRFESIPEIAAKLKGQGIQFRWYILGGGAQETKESIESNIEKFAVQDCVVMLGRKPNPYPYFKKADLLVSTSASEACPMIFNEAKILGLSIVSADFPTAKEFIDNGTNGIISPIEEIGQAIAELTEDKELYATIRQNSYLESSYNDSIITQLKTLFG